MNHTIKSFAIAILVCTAGTAVQHARAHALWDPQGLIKPRSNRDDIKSGPCGEPRGNNPVTLASGATVELSIERTIYHQGYFRIAFSPAGDEDFDAYVLADQVPENSSQRFYNVRVTLPDLECDSCTLQLIQVMLDRNPPTNYYSCADIRLVRATPDDMQPPGSVSQVLPLAGDVEVQLHWTNPSDEDWAGVLIVEGEEPLSAAPDTGREYTAGSSVGNGITVFSGAAGELLITARRPGQTYHYSLFAYDQHYNYAPAVATSVTLKEPMPNLAPTLQLLAEQGGQLTQNISMSAGPVTVQAHISDPNSGDLHQLSWSASDPRLLDVDSVDEQFTFAANTLEPGEYRITATATDNGTPPLSTSIDLTLILESPAPSRGGNSGGTVFWGLLLLLITLRKFQRR